MKYFLQDIADIVKGRIIRQSLLIDVQPVKHLLIDSRRIIYPESSIFIAIKGDRNNGHKYIEEVHEAGVNYFLLQEGAFSLSSLPKGANVIQVENSLVALQELAAFNRSQYQYPVVGITGSNGKTIVKEWLCYLLKDDLDIVRNPRSFNSQVGVPLSVWQMTEQYQLGLFEAGISEKGEMHHLRHIIQPTIGILTNIGSAHDQGFHSRKEKLHEKLQLFGDSELLVFCADQEDVKEGIAQFLPRHTQLKTFSWSTLGKGEDANFEVIKKQFHTSITIRKGAQMLSIQIPFTDSASIANACTCFAFLLAIGRISTDTLKHFEELEAVEMRLQLKEGNNHCVIINDSYTADVIALQVALDFMQQQTAGYSKTVILSDIMETGLKQDELYGEVALLLKQKGVGKLIAIGDQIYKHRKLFEAGTRFYPTTQSFIEQFKSLDFSNEIILLKGSRSFRFEKISTLLEKRVHQTIFEINLPSLIHNLNVYRGRLKPNVKLMAMVKAFSYGAGSYEIAKVLEFHRVDYLTVAYADEGVELRKAGIKLPIMVMNPEASGFEHIIRFNLEPEIYNFFILDQLVKACDGEEVSVHIELDCGMKRLGFEEQQIEELIQTLKQFPNIRIRSLFAHLAASEDKKHDEFTHEQIFRFKRLSDEIMKAFDYPILRHILNSSGIIRFPEAQFDMVRLGIGLYGIDPSEKMQKELQQTGTLKTLISQVRRIKSHETVGYSRKGKVARDSIIATVAIGYADGLNRRLGNGKGYMLVGGQRANIIGSICMDMTMLDVTHIPCKEGDEVIVFGKDPGIIDIAEKTGTIPYEVLTSISQRVKRVYYYE